MTSGEILHNVLFYFFALAAVGGAAAVAFSKNIVRSAFALLMVLFSAAGFYAFLRADFVFAVQIIIYVGGILVLIIFAVMLTHRITDVKLSNESSPGPAAIFACGCVLFALVTVILTHSWVRSTPPVATTVPAGKVVGERAVPVQLSMRQGDGRTGVMLRGALMQGYGTLIVRLDAPPPGIAAARIEVTPRGPEGWGKPVVSKDVALAGSAEGGFESRLALESLPRGVYRWSVGLVKEEERGADFVVTATDLVPFTRHDADDGFDFAVEEGLTRPIGLALMGSYLLPFEAVSVLLLAALIGAAFLARKEVKA